MSRQGNVTSKFVNKQGNLTCKFVYRQGLVTCNFASRQENVTCKFVCNGQGNVTYKFVRQVKGTFAYRQVCQIENLNEFCFHRSAGVGLSNYQIFLFSLINTILKIDPKVKPNFYKSFKD